MCAFLTETSLEMYFVVWHSLARKKKQNKKTPSWFKWHLWPPSVLLYRRVSISGLLSQKKKRKKWCDVRPDNNRVLDTSFPTVIGSDGYQYEQIGSVISPGRWMEAPAKITHLWLYCFILQGQRSEKHKKNTQIRQSVWFLTETLSILLKRNKPVNIGWESQYLNSAHTQ